MARAALLLEKLEQYDQAEEIIKKNYRRYPSSVYALTEYIRFLWHRKRFEEANILIKNFKHHISFENWDEYLGEDFFNTFSNNQNQGIKIFNQLLRSRIPPMSLMTIPRKAWDKGNAEFAFKLITQIRLSGPDRVTIAMEAYRYLKKIRGKAKALSWLKTQIPGNQLFPSTMMAFKKHYYDLLWDLIPEPVWGEGRANIWAMRAAAFFQFNDDYPKKKLLIKYYSGDNWESISQTLEAYVLNIGMKITEYFKIPISQIHYHAVGRYLLGLTTEESLLKFITDEKKLCEISYYIGLKAVSEQNFKKASKWFRVCIETGLNRNGEYHWAYDRLFWYEEDDFSLSTLKS